MAVVLRVDGPAVDFETCRDWLPKAGLERVWRAGERVRPGAVTASSGFNFLFSDAEAGKWCQSSCPLFCSKVCSRLLELRESPERQMAT